MQKPPNSMTDIINVTPTPRLEITTPAVPNPGVIVELEAMVEVNISQTPRLSDCVVNCSFTGLGMYGNTMQHNHFIANKVSKFPEGRTTLNHESGRSQS